MTGGLQTEGGGGPLAVCSRCGALAAGPCARCQLPVCGDCCVLTEGGNRVWAICLGCEDRGGRSLRRAWIRVLGWIALPIFILFLLLIALQWLVAK